MAKLVEAEQPVNIDRLIHKHTNPELDKKRDYWIFMDIIGYLEPA